MKCFSHLTKVFLMVLLAASVAGCAAGNVSDATTADGDATASTKKGKKSKREVYNPVGEWKYSVDSPQGSTSGTMVIEGTPGTYEVVLKTDQFGEVRIYDLDMTGQSMSGKADTGGTTVEVEGDFDGDYFTGAIIVGDQVFPLEAVRVSKG